MPDLPTLGWMFAIAGGALILGLAIAYGILHNRRLTDRERRMAERGAREIYEKDGR